MPAHAPASPIADPAPSATLRGPTVHARTDAPSLLDRSFDGALVQLQVDPAEAALDLLDLDDDARQRALAVLDKRSGILDRIVGRNLGTLTEINTAVSTGRMFRVLQLASDLHRQFTLEAGDTALVDQLAAVLPSHDAHELRRVVDEYWTAFVHEEGGARVGRIESFVIRRRAALEVFGKEIERATDRVTADATSASDHWDRMLSALGLSPEQELEIRSMGRDFYINTNLNPTKEDTADFLIRVYHKLDGAQREKFFRLIVSAN